MCTLKLWLAVNLHPAGKVPMYDDCDDSRKELLKALYTLKMIVGCWMDEVFYKLYFNTHICTLCLASAHEAGEEKKILHSAEDCI